MDKHEEINKIMTKIWTGKKTSKKERKTAKDYYKKAIEKINKQIKMIDDKEAIIQLEIFRAMAKDLIGKIAA